MNYSNIHNTSCLHSISTEPTLRFGMLSVSVNEALVLVLSFV